jgi:hypothetical protein
MPQLVDHPRSGNSAEEGDRRVSVPDRGLSQPRAVSDDAQPQPVVGVRGSYEGVDERPPAAFAADPTEIVDSDSPGLSSQSCLDTCRVDAAPVKSVRDYS